MSSATGIATEEAFIPVIDLEAQLSPLKADLLKAFERVIDHRGFCLGPEVEAFEKAFAEFQETKHVIGVNSGTSALHIAALLLDLGPGDEVITTPFTFVATSWAISYVGATPVFVDVDPDTLNIDPAKLEAARTERTKAVFAVHLYGHPCDLDGVSAFCEKHGLPLVEDSAQAHGARYGGKAVGSTGAFSTYSFYPGKNLGACGEGGALTTDDDQYVERARALRNHGAAVTYHHDEVGYNYRMEGMQAAALAIKLPLLDGWTEGRRRVAAAYLDQLADTPLTLPVEKEGCRHVYHQFTARHPERDALREFLQERNIGSGLHYPLALHQQKCYADLGYSEGSFPVAEQAAAECVSLPAFPEMTDAQIDRVCEGVRAFFASR